MTDAARQYAELMKTLLNGRASGQFIAAEDEEDRILELMDLYWWSMTDDEQYGVELRWFEVLCP